MKIKVPIKDREKVKELILALWASQHELEYTKERLEASYKEPDKTKSDMLYGLKISQYQEYLDASENLRVGLREIFTGLPEELDFKISGFYDIELY